MSVVEANQGNFTFQSAQAANANGEVFDNERLQFGWLVVHIIGATFTGVVNFEATTDPAAAPAFVAIRGENLNDGVFAALATNPGSVLYRFNISGLRKIRMRTSAVTVGSVSVHCRAQAFN